MDVVRQGLPIVLGLLGSLLLQSYSCHANTQSMLAEDVESWNVSLGIGHGTRHINAHRVAVSKSYGPIAWKASSWRWHFIWENSFSSWNSDPPPKPLEGPDSLVLATTGPMFRLEKSDAIWDHIRPYIEGGIAVSWLSETEIGGRRLSLHFQFEDKCGIGVRLGSKGSADFTFRLHHYSNASIKKPNSGVNLYLLSLGYWFLI